MVGGKGAEVCFLEAGKGHQGKTMKRGSKVNGSGFECAMVRKAGWAGSENVVQFCAIDRDAGHTEQCGTEFNRPCIAEVL